eukprot:450588_1
MTMYRRVLAIVSRSFYNTNRRHIKSIQKLHPKSSLLRARARVSSSSARLSHHQRRNNTSVSSTTSHNTTPNTEPKSIQSRLISTEAAEKPRRSFKRRMVWIAAITSLSYVGYKYYMYNDDDTEEEAKPSMKSAVLKTAQEMIENTLLNYSRMTLKLGVLMDRKGRYKEALYFYKLYLRDPSTKTGESAALNNMAVVYYRLNEFENALIALQLLGKEEITTHNLEFIRAHCHHILSEYDLAILWYNAYLSNPASQTDRMKTYNNMALLYYEIGHYEAAYSCFSELGDETIKEKQYLFRVAHCLQYMNEFEKSLEYYNAYLDG